jgi:hypothetical protein
MYNRLVRLFVCCRRAVGEKTAAQTYAPAIMMVASRWGWTRRAELSCEGESALRGFVSRPQLKSNNYNCHDQCGRSASRADCYNLPKPTHTRTAYNPRTALQDSDHIALFRALNAMVRRAARFEWRGLRLDGRGLGAQSLLEAMCSEMHRTRCIWLG